MQADNIRSEDRPDPCEVKQNKGARNDKMKKLMMIAGAIVLAGMTGCVTHPLAEQSTEYDKQSYAAENARPIPQGKYNIEIHSKSMPANPATEKGYVSVIDKAMEEKATARLNGLGWFQIANRRDVQKVANANAVNGDANANDAGKLMKSDLIFVADSAYTLYHKEKLRPCNSVRDAGAISIKSDFRLEDVATGKILIQKTAEIKSPAYKKATQVLPVVPDVVDANVKDFAELLSSRFLPGAPVLETRGSGKCARVKMGKNYQLAPGSKVDFFVDEKTADGSFDRRVFATGTVLEDGLEEKQCWVEVDNYEAANVHVGHSVKVQESATK
jgi:hypothetical protein